jgi:hypothetical protein
MFFVLMVGTPRSPSPPLRGPTVDGGCSRISSTTSKGARHRYFFALIVGTLGSLAPPPRGATVDDFCIDGAPSWIFGTASQGAHRLCFLRAWWVLSDL